MDDGDAALGDCDCREVAEGEEGLAPPPVPDAMLHAVDVVDASAAGAGTAAAPGEGAVPVVNDWGFCCWVPDEG